MKSLRHTILLLLYLILKEDMTEWIIFLPVQIRDTYSCPYIGLDYEVIREKSVLTHPSTLMMSLLGKKIITVKVKPSSDRPRELILEVRKMQWLFVVQDLRNRLSCKVTF